MREKYVQYSGHCMLQRKRLAIESLKTDLVNDGKCRIHGLDNDRRFSVLQLSKIYTFCD